MMGVLSTRDDNDASLTQKARTCPKLVGRDLVREVVPGESFVWDKASRALHCARLTGSAVALSCGRDRLRHEMEYSACLVQIGCRVTVVPGTASAEEVLQS